MPLVLHGASGIPPEIVKKAKKKRGYTLAEKKDNLFNRLTIKNPLTFYKKVYIIYNDYLKNINYVTFQAWKDDKEKRERVYKE